MTLAAKKNRSVGISTYREDFERFDQGVDGNLPSWVTPLRRAAFSRWAERGFPTRHDEEWRFTNVAPIERVPFRLGEPVDDLTPQALADVTFGDMPCIQLVFVNGHYVPELGPFASLRPLPDGITVTSLADALRDDALALEPHLARHAGVEQHSFTALNTAFLNDGAFVHIARGVAVPDPIHLLFVSTITPSLQGGGTGGGVSHPRTLVVAEENSQATVIESYVGLDDDAVYFTNAVTEIVAADNALVDHYKLSRESARAFHIANMQIRLSGGAHFTSHSVTLGGALVRNDVGAVLGGERIECTLNGLYLATGEQVVDNHTAIDHALPHCASHEVYKGILDDRARGIFNGKIFVREDAQKTDAKQTNKTLLLSSDAQINTKPQLEIYADDVRCTHGATIGQLSEEQIFYLRARGIGKNEARNLLVYAFAGDIIDRIKVGPIRDRLSQSLFARLAKAEREA